MKNNVSGFVSLKDRDALDRLAARAGRNRAQYLRTVIDDFLAYPGRAMADNVEVPGDQYGTTVGTQIEDQQFAGWCREAQRRGMMSGTLLRIVIVQHIEGAGEPHEQPAQKLTPPLNVEAIQPVNPDRRRKPYIHVDRDPVPWLRMAFWSRLKVVDICRITGCSTTAANRLAQELMSTGSVCVQDKALVLLPGAEFTETPDQFFHNMLQATLAGEGTLRACGADLPVSIRLQPSSVEAAVLKVLIAAFADPNQLVDALVGDDLIRLHPLEFIFEAGAWKLRANEFLAQGGGGLIGERTIALADIAEAELYLPPKAEPKPPKRRGRKPKAPPVEPETFDKSNRILVPAGALEVGGVIAGKRIAKLGRAAYDVEHEQIMQYAYLEAVA